MINQFIRQYYYRIGCFNIDKCIGIHKNNKYINIDNININNNNMNNINNDINNNMNNKTSQK